MKKFAITFIGRRSNAIAARNFHRLVVSAKNADHAVAIVYNSYEQCSRFNIRELSKGGK